MQSPATPTPGADRELRTRHNMETIYCENRNGATLQRYFQDRVPISNARLLGLGRLPKPAALALSL